MKKKPKLWRRTRNTTHDTWVTADHKQVKIVDMSNYHLLNALRLLHRRIRVFIDRHLAYYKDADTMTHTDLATEHIASQIDYWDNIDPHDLLMDYEPSYPTMIDELNNRGLTFTFEEEEKNVQVAEKK